MLGWIAERLPHIVREIHTRGHEVASHGYYHNLCNQQSPDALKKDLEDSKKLLEDILGAPVFGYRAPSFSITHDILKIIEDCGYLYDSSFNSFGMHGRYGQVDLAQNEKKGMAVPIKRPLKTFPRQIGKWSFLHSRSLSQQVEQKLGVDDYLECDYVSPAGQVVNLYVSYFSSMEGKGFHSPRNCMPGSGWDVASLEPLVLEVHYSKSMPVEINNMIL